MRLAALFAIAMAALAVAAVTLAVPRSGDRARPSSLHWTAASLREVALPVRFVRSPPSLLRQCLRTARAVHYAVPCPLMIPVGLQPTPVTVGPCSHYRFQILGIPCAAFSGLWGGWVVGSSQIGSAGAGFQHLVIQVSPRPVSYAHAVDGPIALWPGAGPKIGGTIVLHSWHMHWLFVDPEHNDGSAFMSHVVLCWTTGGHSYALGFHAVTTEVAAAAMDFELIRHLEFVGA